nr:nitrilase-related carbon-nitrogen hydrolase [Paraflavitalea speifideiaquila]
MENQTYVVGVNRVGKDGKDIYHSGDSMIVDPMGEVLYTKAHEEDIHTITLQKKSWKRSGINCPSWKMLIILSFSRKNNCQAVHQR